MHFSTFSAVAALVALTAAHPGHDLIAEIAERAIFKQASRRNDLSHCSSQLKARGIEQRNLARRSQAVQGLRKRSLESDLASDHNTTTLGYTKSTAGSTIFASNSSCVLTPEVTDGPYYVTGEYVRKNIVEYQAGVPITFDYQVLDVDTCEPVPDVYVEIWHCNATGVYSGVDSPQGGLDATWLRGIQLTDNEGVAQFDSIFPGHYTGRATHIHVLVHQNATIYRNGTLGHDALATHVGQAFFDQTLISAVESASPYTLNEQALTENSADDILASEAATEGVDPIMQYTLLGNDVSEGIFAWLSFSVNVTAASNAGAAAIYYAGGGITNPDGPPAVGPSKGNSTTSAAPTSADA
ncbi:hypothetical protein JX265_013816 [Neoarthrinium moseri]|uniref:Intradiol ring-cleavage dioxygenases domain-containing protein n=1 Tax=Neoarthrinium moseri TaxID=1658444 RepID=A0A9Q0AIC3_9PEZI|nr:hypothetical protein JX265_013816 [Neoarthrinium moseri]